MLFYFTDDRGHSIAFERIEPTKTVPAVVHVMVFNKSTDMSESDPDLEFEINADAFKKMADLVT